MTHFEIQSDDLPPHPHKGHRTLDVTAIGAMPRKLLCLDCKLEYEEPVPVRDRAWMERAL
jgi:hypothetical protein